MVETVGIEPTQLSISKLIYIYFSTLACLCGQLWLECLLCERRVCVVCVWLKVCRGEGSQCRALNVRVV